MLRIPNIMIIDYEHAKALAFFHPTAVLLPDIIPENAINHKNSQVFKYPGIKEDVYVPAFKPDPHIKELLGLDKKDLVVTIRPPASEAHYHNPESEQLFNAIVDLLSMRADIKIVMLPRNDKQGDSIRQQWSAFFSAGKIIIPNQVVDGLNLMWYSDFVISGGGTMNREAAALGVPVYSIFRGKIGTVDRYLSNCGRLILLESISDIHDKLKVVRRQRPESPSETNNATLKSIVNIIASMAEKKSSAINDKTYKAC
jgi:predicted glycosyltransferase